MERTKSTVFSKPLEVIYEDEEAEVQAKEMAAASKKEEDKSFTTQKVQDAATKLRIALADLKKETAPFYAQRISEDKKYIN